MKKIGFFLISALLIIGGLASCGSKSSDETLATMIENGDQLSQEDYTVIINYVGEYAEKAQQYAVATGDEAAEQLANLKKEYPYLAVYRDCIGATSLKDLSKENLELIGKYAGYVEFTTPAGFTIQTNPEAAGLEVATPDSANGVIAGAVDTIEVKR